MPEKRIRVLIAKPGLDGHDRGAKVIALSNLSGAHNTICPQLMSLLRAKGMDDVTVVVGGIIPGADIPILKEAGISEIFLPGTSTQAIIDFIQKKHAHNQPA